jgi:hypothetical protein
MFTAVRKVVFFAGLILSARGFQGELAGQMIRKLAWLATHDHLEAYAHRRHRAQLGQYGAEFRVDEVPNAELDSLFAGREIG